MEWISNAKCGQELNTGTIFNAKKIGRRVTIHKLHGLGNDWYLTSRDLGIERENLRTEDFEQAIQRAKDIVRLKLFTFNQLFKDFLEDDTETTFTRY